MRVTNNANVSLSTAVWLLHDDYDFIDEENYISVTQLMKPLRHIILPRRIAAEQKEPMDVLDFVATGLGKSIHDSMEKAWVKGYRKNLQKLGTPDSVIDMIRINPTEEQAKEKNIIPIYLEQRAIKSINGYRLGGKFDMIADGMLQDNKSTGTFTWTNGTRDDEHRLQGSLYRWLNPEKITEEFIRINYIFTDWTRMMAKSANYPPHRVMHKDIPLMSYEDTEKWIIEKLSLLDKYWNAPEETIPVCTEEELWRSPPKFKYFADPAKTDGRSSKNFDDPVEARQYVQEKGKGIIKVEASKPKRCGYCQAFPMCTQKDAYFNHD